MMQQGIDYDNLTFVTLIKRLALWACSTALLPLVLIAGAAHGISALSAGDKHVSGNGKPHAITANLANCRVVKVLLRLHGRMSIPG